MIITGLQGFGGHYIYTYSQGEDALPGMRLSATRIGDGNYQATFRTTSDLTSWIMQSTKGFPEKEPNTEPVARLITIVRHRWIHGHG